MHKKSLIIISHKLHEIHPDSRKIFVKGGFPIITNEFAKYFENVILAVPVRVNASIETLNPYKKNVVLERLNLGVTILGKAKKFYEIARVIKNNKGIVYAMTPNMTGILGMIWAKIFNRDFFISVDTDKAEVIRMNTKKKWWGFLRSNLIKTFHYSLIKILAKNRPLFMSGNMFLGENKNWHQWVKSTHKLKEIRPYKAPNNSTEGKFSLIYVGRLSPEKNIGTLINSLNTIDSQKYSLKIVGEGTEDQNLKKLTACLGLSNIEFIGYVDNDYLKKTRFLNSDLLVLPSLSERQGKVLTEAMACSVPVMASDTQGIASIIKHKINGILFNSKNVSELSQKIIEMSEDLTLRKNITKSGYNFIKEHALDIEIEKIINTVHDFYEQK